jgi:DNA-binding transcriptional ArsR family regulator
VHITRGHRNDLAGMDGETAELVADIIQALATPSRIRILSALAQGPRSVSELTAQLDMEQPAVSQQLRVLRDSGLVTGERRGRRVIYTLHDRHVAKLLRQALAHAEHVESQRAGTVAS